VIYADTSALGRAYFADEPDHAALRSLLLGGRETVVTSSLTRVEIASAAHRATRAGRIRDGSRILERFDADCSADGPIVRLRVRSNGLLAVAVDLVAAHALRVLDAIHLAVALTDGRALANEEPLTFVTRDVEQAVAARAHGLAVA